MWSHGGEDMGLDIGDDEGKCLFDRFDGCGGKCADVIDLVSFGVFDGDLDGFGIDIDTKYRGGTQFGCGHRQDTRTASDVEEFGGAWDEFFEKMDTAFCCGVVSCPEGHPWIEPEKVPCGVGSCFPGGADKDMLSDGEWFEKGLPFGGPTIISELRPFECVGGEMKSLGEFDDALLLRCIE